MKIEDILILINKKGSEELKKRKKNIIIMLIKGDKKISSLINEYIKTKNKNKKDKLEKEIIKIIESEKNRIQLLIKKGRRKIYKSF